MQRRDDDDAGDERHDRHRYEDDPRRARLLERLVVENDAVRVSLRIRPIVPMPQRDVVVFIPLFFTHRASKTLEPPSSRALVSTLYAFEKRKTSAKAYDAEESFVDSVERAHSASSADAIGSRATSTVSGA